MGLVLSGSIAACGGNGDTELTPSPTPPEEFGESLQNNAWEGWYSYGDEQLEVNTYLTLAIFEYRAGLWCGVLIQDYTREGAYLGYSTLAGWNEVVNNDGSNAAEYGAVLGRVYGMLYETEYMTGWIDSLNDLTLAEPASTPAMEGSDMDLLLELTSTMSLSLDPLELTVPEVLAMMDDAAHTSSGSTTGEPSATEPTFTSVDLPKVTLAGPARYTNEFLNVNYCEWAAEPTSNIVRSPRPPRE